MGQCQNTAKEQMHEQVNKMKKTKIKHVQNIPADSQSCLSLRLLFHIHHILPCLILGLKLQEQTGNPGNHYAQWFHNSINHSDVPRRKQSPAAHSMGFS